MGREHEDLKKIIKATVVEATKLYDEPDYMADFVANGVMCAVYDHFRSITEIHAIVDAVRCGMRVQVDYYNEEDEENECVVRQEW